MNKVKIERLDHVAIDADDISKSKQFYGDLLGLAEVSRPESFDFPGAWFEIGNAFLHIVGGRKASTGPHHFAFMVDDVHALAKKLGDVGYEVNWDPYKISGLDRFFTFDPDGNRVEMQGAEMSPSAGA